MLQGHSTAADNITDARDLALEEDKAGSRAHGTGGVMERCVHGEDERRKKKKRGLAGGASDILLTVGRFCITEMIIITWNAQ